MNYPLVQITWIDSTNKAGWVSIDEVAEELTGPDCVSVGFLLEEDDFFVYLASTVSGYGCLSPISIPSASIVDREVLVEAHEDEDTDE